jgi:universal stress protein A
MEDVKNILVVSRMTKDCQKAVHYGVALSRQFGTRLCVLHVEHNPFGLGGWNLPMPYSLEDEYHKVLKDAKKDLDKIIEMEQAKGMQISVSIKEGEPTEEILKFVKEQKIDLMILAAHEEGRFEHFLFGRSNEALLRRMPCSILMVKKEPEAITEM